MKITLIRHATLQLEYGGLTWLVDPMFAEAGAIPPIPNTPNALPNPLLPMPVAAEALSRPDAVLVTHLHPDHWDASAASALDKDAALFCQPGDEETIAASGFAGAAAVAERTVFRGVTISRTNGRHGTGEIGERMGNVSGFVLQAAGEPTLYFAGDTIWCGEVRAALDAFRPDATVVNAGGARFLQGDPITMDADDVARLLRHAPYTEAVAVHMEAINHCIVTRADLRSRLEAEGLAMRCRIPADGETMVFGGGGAA